MRPAAATTAMTGKRLAYTAIAGLLVLLLLFDVSFAPRFALPRDVTRPDPGQEGRYSACVEARDAAIHERAFGTIDNPDVQKLYIAAEREKARAECRERFPERLVTTREPFRFNLLDFELRF